MVSAKITQHIDSLNCLVECADCGGEFLDTPVQYVSAICENCDALARTKVTYYQPDNLGALPSETAAECNGCGEYWEAGEKGGFDEGRVVKRDCPPCAKRWPS